MSDDVDAADRLKSSWDDNAQAWTTTVRESRIESRRVATDRAIVDAVLQRKPARVLDVGCGEGWLCRALRQHGVSCTGVDGSSDLIQAARSVDPDGAYHLLRYEDFDRLAVVVEAASIDVAVCNFALLHHDVQPILRAVRTVLRPGGALLVQTVHPWTASECSDYADGWRTENFAWSECCFPKAMPWYFRTLQSWVSTIREAGFVLDHVTEPAHPQSKTPLSLLLSAVRPTVPGES